MAVQPSVVVRKAKEEDYQDVLDITDEFNSGADYLNVQYSELINDSDSAYYLCEVEGEVAAFEGVSLIDDNETLMTRSARVKDKFRGQGLLTSIRKKIYEDYKDVPGQKRIRTCCTNLVRLVYSPTFRSQNRVLAVRSLVAYQPMETIQLQEPYDKHIPDVRELDLQDLSLIFQNQQLVDYLFPSGFLSVISWFFEPRVSNIKHIKKQRPHVVISTALDSHVKKLSCPANSEQSQQGISDCDQETSVLPSSILAITADYKAPTMIVFSVDIYGEPRPGHEDSDVRHVLFHCLRLAISVMEHDESKLPLCLAIDAKDNVIAGICKNVLKPLGFQQGNMDIFECHYFFEQDFEQLAK